MRMARKTQVEIQSLLARAQKPLTPLRPPKRIRVADLTFRLARGQIQSTTASWLILPDRSLPKAKLAREAFPKPPKAPGSFVIAFQAINPSLTNSNFFRSCLFFCLVTDGSLIYERIVLPHREAERIKRRPEDSPSDGICLNFFSLFCRPQYLFCLFFFLKKLLLTNDQLEKVQPM